MQPFQSVVSPHGDCPRKPNGDSPRGGIRQLRHRIGSLPGSRYQRDGNHICHTPHKPCKRSNRLFRQTGTVPAGPTGTVPAAGSDNCGTRLVPYRAAATSVTAIIFVTTPKSRATVPISCFAQRGQSPRMSRMSRTRMASDPILRAQIGWRDRGADAEVGRLSSATSAHPSVTFAFRFPTRRGQSPRRDQTAAGPDWFLAEQPLPARRDLNLSHPLQAVQKFQSVVSPHGDCARKPNGDSPRGGIRQLRGRIGFLPGSRYQRDET